MPSHVELSDRPASEHDQTAKYQNNYRLESNNPFRCEPVDQLVESILKQRLGNFSYDTNASAKVCADTAAHIQTSLQQLKYHRYKIVVAMTIVEKASQSMEASMGFLWDSRRDRYSAYTFEARTFYAYCAVFGLYYE